MIKNEALYNYLKNISTLTVTSTIKVLGLPEATTSNFSRGKISDKILLELYLQFEKDLKRFKDEMNDSLLVIAVIIVVNSEEILNDGFSVPGQKYQIEDYIRKMNLSNSTTYTRFIDLVQKIDFFLIVNSVIIYAVLNYSFIVIKT